MPLKEIIEKNKKAEELKVNPMLGIFNVMEKTNGKLEEINKTAKQILDKEAPEMPEFPEFPQKMKVEIEGASVITIKGDKGDKGDDGKTPTKEELTSLIKPLIPPSEKGDKGDSYILTEKDKREIASKIKVPIVERVEIIKEQPIIKEVAMKDTQEELEKKVSKIKIKKSNIEGLDDEIDSIKKAINNVSGSKKGGGMGNWVHERFSISSATTTISLQNNVAAGGMAHIARYNGQVQDLDTDYSISGKTITLLFTPDDSTIFSIAYVRT